MLKISIKHKIFLASITCLFNLIFLIYFLFNTTNFESNSFYLGYLVGFSAFSMFFVRETIKEYRNEVEKLWSGLQKSTG